MSELTEKELDELDSGKTNVMNQKANRVRVDPDIMRRLLDDSRQLRRMEPCYDRQRRGLQRVVNLGSSAHDDGSGCAQLARRILDGRET